jgi:hypothetical protein
MLASNRHMIDLAHRLGMATHIDARDPALIAAARWL